MNGPFLRMLWKEYRSLRVLWIGVTLGTLGLWGVLLLVVNREMRRDVEIFPLLWVLSLWLPAFYLLACTSAQFAGEQEERTGNWLIHLGTPFRAAISAKLVWTAVTSLAMQAILFSVALWIGRWINAQFTTGGPLIAGDEQFRGTASFATFLVVESLAWGIFWSLQSQSVIRALLSSAILVVIINALAGSIIEPEGPGVIKILTLLFGPWGSVRTAVTLGVLAVDCVLARQWLAGRAGNWSIPWERFRPVARRALVSRAIREPGTGWSRAWQRFRWLEWQTIRGYLWLYLAGCGLLLVWAFLSLFWFGRPSYGSPMALYSSGMEFPLFAAMVCPLVTGLMAWQGEQRREQFRFHVNRGVSPIGLWCNKLGLWFAVCALSSAVLTGIALGHLAAHLAWWDDRRWRPDLAGPWEGLIHQVPYFVWAGVAMFLGAFTVGLYFRRTIYAVAVGTFLTVLLAWLAPISVEYGLPTSLCLIPVAAWLGWCGLRQLPRWYLERTGWKTCVVIAAEWLVFPSVLYVVAATYWVYTVPMPDVEQIIQEPYRNAQLPPATQIDAQWRAASQAIENLCRAHGDLLTMRDTDRDDDVSRQFTAEEWMSLEPDVRQIRDLLLAPIGLSRTTNFHQLSEKHHLFGNRVVLHVLMQGANRALLANQKDESLRYIRAAVRFGGAVWIGAPLDAQHAGRRKKLHADLHGRLVAWAQLSPPHPELVAEAIQQIQGGEQRFWLPDNLTLEADHRRRLDGIAEARRDLGWGYPPWVAVRHRRLAACAFSNRANHLANPIPYLIHHPWAAARSYLLIPDRERAWTFREAPQRAHQSALPMGLDRDFLTWSNDQEIRLRCTLWMMAVVAFRATHGRLPVSFDELSPAFGPADNWQLRRQMTELKLQTDGKWPPIYPYHMGRNTDDDPGIPFVYVKPFTGQWGEPYLFPVPPPTAP